MPLFRLLTIALVIWIVWRIWRILTTRRRPGGDPANDAVDTVQCARCRLHLPRAAALRHDADWFCCEAHRAEHIAHRK